MYIFVTISFETQTMHAQGVTKVTYQKEFEYLPYGSNKRADFFVNDRSMFKVYIHKDMSRETLCQVSLLASTKKFYFSHR